VTDRNQSRRGKIKGIHQAPTLRQIVEKSRRQKKEDKEKGNDQKVRFERPTVLNQHKSMLAKFQPPSASRSAFRGRRAHSVREVVSEPPNQEITSFSLTLANSSVVIPLIFSVSMEAAATETVQAFAWKATSETRAGLPPILICRSSVSPQRGLAA